MKEKETRITGTDGRIFLVRMVRRGDKYGLNDCLTHGEKRSMVEFYDLSQKGFGPRGQFVSSYYASTLLEPPHGRGLCLDGGNADVWSIEEDQMVVVRDWIARAGS